jgi:hypothetical protein
MSSMPAMVDAADRNDLKSSIGRATRLTEKRPLTFTYASSIRQLEPTGRFARAKLLIQQRHVFDHPAIERGMVDFDAVALPSFLQAADS